MQVQVNANHSVHTHESLERWAREELSAGLSRFSEDITSVEVHLSDENSDKISSDHKRCVLEARLAKHAPVTVNHQAPGLDEAFRGAAEKLKRALEHTFGRLRDKRDRESIRRGAGLAEEGGEDLNASEVNPASEPAATGPERL